METPDRIHSLIETLILIPQIIAPIRSIPRSLLHYTLAGCRIRRLRRAFLISKELYEVEAVDTGTEVYTEMLSNGGEFDAFVYVEFGAGADEGTVAVVVVGANEAEMVAFDEGCGCVGVRIGGGRESDCEGRCEDSGREEGGEVEMHC